MNEPQTNIYEFGNFRLDSAKRLLLNNTSEIVPLMPKAFDTLLYLVSHSGELIEKDRMMREIWTDTIVEENNLTQNISILRRIFGEKPGEHRFIVTVPGHGYKFVAEVRAISDLGFGIADVEAEDVVSADNGLPLQPQITKEKIVRNEKTSRFWLLALAVFSILILSSLGFYLWRDTTRAAPDSPIKTLAVLPFRPIVADNRDEALQLGMADTLISKLSAGSQEITVRPLSAIRKYNSPEQDSVMAGRELGVEAVLDGSLQISGDKIRVLAKLLRTGDGKQLWAEQFDEKFTDIFTVQDSISERVAAALKIHLGDRKEKRPTENVEAYQLYMRGRYHSLNLTRAETDKAITYFGQAIELDPNYALAYVGLSQSYLPMALSSEVLPGEVVPKAKAAALKAIELDESLAEAHFALGLALFFYDRDWAAAENQFRRALELDPNSAEAHFGYAHLLSNTGRHEQALAEIKLSRELAPLFLRTGALEGQILFFAGKTDESIDRLNKTIELNPNFWLSHLFLSATYIEKGMYPEAVAAAQKAGDISGNSQSEAYRSYALAKWGKIAEARILLNNLLKLSKTSYVPPYNFAIIYNGLGESSKALDFLEKGFAEKDVRMVFLKVDPKWNNLRREPRFIELMKRMNFEL